jgi:hypothetical protein
VAFGAQLSPVPGPLGWILIVGGGLLLGAGLIWLGRLKERFLERMFSRHPRASLLFSLLIFMGVLVLGGIENEWRFPAGPRGVVAVVLLMLMVLPLSIFGVVVIRRRRHVHRLETGLWDAIRRRKVLGEPQPWVRDGQKFQLAELHHPVLRTFIDGLAGLNEDQWHQATRAAACEDVAWLRRPGARRGRRLASRRLKRVARLADEIATQVGVAEAFGRAGERLDVWRVLDIPERLEAAELAALALVSRAQLSEKEFAELHRPFRQLIPVGGEPLASRREPR